MICSDAAYDPGTVASTAPSMIYELNGKVEVAGMEVEPGELVHMDHDGAEKFKAEMLEELLEMCRAEKTEKTGRIRRKMRLGKYHFGKGWIAYRL